MLIIIPLHCYILGQTQNSSYYNISIPNLTLKSPEVQGMERYGEIPVSEYSGTPSINIPLYTVKEGSIELPITLDYHATGIQVTQEATWVGLGWNLIAGGSISRIPMGPVDDIINTFDFTADWSNMLDYSGGQYMPTGGFPRRFTEPIGTANAQCPCLWSGWVYNEQLNVLTNNVLMNSLYGNGERDVYSANFLGYNFKYSIHPITKSPVFLGAKNKFKIEKTSDGSGWILIDEIGVSYTFSAYETANIQTLTQNNRYLSTWYLTKIKSQDAEINIKYNSVSGIELLPTISESNASGYPSEYGNMNLASRTINVNRLENQLYLASIETPSQTIYFTTKSRQDIRKALALDEMIVKSLADQSIVKRYKFVHEYFIGTTNGSDIRTEDYVRLRLKLTNLYRTDGTNKGEKYDFEYNSTQLPYKTSFSQDYWGYYNGEDNKCLEEVFSNTLYPELYSKFRSLIPSALNLFIGDETEYKEISGDVSISKSPIMREASKTYIKAGILESIKYPTGGKTVFEFEPHTFSNYLHPCTEDMNTLKYPTTDTKKFQVLSNNNDTSHKLNITTVNVTKAQKLTLTATFRSTQYDFFAMMPSYVKITGVIDGKSQTVMLQMQQSSQYCNNGQTCDMNTFNNNKSIVKTFSFNAVPGNYTLEAKIASGIPNQGYNFSTAAEGVMSVVYTTNNDLFTQAKAFASYGGGLRIKQITNFDKDGSTKLTKKTYNYTQNDGKTSGILIYPINFYNKNIVTIKIAGASEPSKSYSSTIRTFSSGNSFAYSPHAYGGVVGYSRVEIASINPLSSFQNNGKEIKEFINVSGSFYNDFLFPDKSKNQYNNGAIAKNIILNSSNDTIVVETFDYGINNMEAHYINFRVKDNYIGPNNMNSMGGNNYRYSPRFDILGYPTNSYLLQLNSKKKVEYFGKNTVTTVTSYEYDQTNYKIKKITENLDSKKRITEYKYPHSYTGNNVYTTMIGRNMYSPVIEESITEGPVLAFNKKTDYGIFESIVAPQNILIKNAKQTEESRIVFQGYYSFGKPKYITMDGITKVIYIWGYKGLYPIAEIKNATYSQITEIIPEATLVTIANKVEPIESDWTFLKNLQDNTTLKNALVTIYKYRPLVGISEIIDPRGISTFYEYDSFLRLKEIYIKENDVKKILQAFDYNYFNK